MKTLREYKTKGDYLYCDVTFIPDYNVDPEQQEDEMFPLLRGTQVHMRLSALVRYPDGVSADMVTSRLSVLSHPNVSPKLVVGEVSKFISLISQMYEL